MAIGVATFYAGPLGNAGEMQVAESPERATRSHRLRGRLMMLIDPRAVLLYLTAALIVLTTPPCPMALEIKEGTDSIRIGYSLAAFRIPGIIALSALIGLALSRHRPGLLSSAHSLLMILALAISLGVMVHRSFRWVEIDEERLEVSHGLFFHADGTIERDDLLEIEERCIHLAGERHGCSTFAILEDGRAFVIDGPRDGDAFVDYFLMERWEIPGPEREKPELDCAR